VKVSIAVTAVAEEVSEMPRSSGTSKAEEGSGDGLEDSVGLITGIGVGIATGVADGEFVSFERVDLNCD
jgi:hypothetical protein